MKNRCSVLTILSLLTLCKVKIQAQEPFDIRLRSATDNREFVLSQQKGKFVSLHFY
jgi:hypothetical protein